MALLARLNCWYGSPIGHFFSKKVIASPYPFVLCIIFHFSSRYPSLIPPTLVYWICLNYVWPGNSIASLFLTFLIFHPFSFPFPNYLLPPYVGSQKQHHECPLCRAKLASRRSSKPDPNFDTLIGIINLPHSVNNYKANHMRLIAYNYISQHLCLLFTRNYSRSKVWGASNCQGRDQGQGLG